MLLNQVVNESDLIASSGYTITADRYGGTIHKKSLSLINLIIIIIVVIFSLFIGDACLNRYSISFRSLALNKTTFSA